MVCHVSRRLVLVYRLGGLSCDATVMSVDQGLQIIVSHVRNANLGGQDIIDLVTEHLRDEFKRYVDGSLTCNPLFCRKSFVLGKPFLVTTKNLDKTILVLTKNPLF